MCDVDYFKRYNDAYGHLAGDKVLERVAGTLIRGLGTRDRGYRFGGEEFLLILGETPFQSARLAAERYRRRVHGSRPRTPYIRLSVWAGIKFTPETSDRAFDTANNQTFQSIPIPKQRLGFYDFRNSRRAGGHRIIDLTK
jgi:diguanylate cyclase (GGDEF)-like protein